jgi:threonine dehydrogenase-like Zn-dependent dehydrogenase
MKALVVRKPGRVELVEMDKPVPTPGWVRVRVGAVGICMTDFEVIQGTIEARYPLIPGHEWCGVVDAVGSQSDETWVGRKVTGDNEITCGECVYCRRSEWRRCPHYEQIGFDASGAYAEYLLVPTRNLHLLSETVSFDQGAILEPLGVGLAVARLAQARPGLTAAILGTGPIGLNCLTALKASGAIRVLCLDLRKFRLDMAQSWGAAEVYCDFGDLAVAAKRLHPEGTEIVVDTTGNIEIIRAGIEMTCFGGAFILAGFCRHKPMEIHPDTIHLKNMRVLGAGCNSGFTGVAARCVAAGALATEPMITHHYRLEDYASALSRDTVAETGYIKGIFVP